MSGVGEFEALFRRHHAAVLRYALRRVEPEQAPDIVSEVFLVAWRRRELEPVDSVAWLLAVARRVVANSRRADGRRDSLWLRLAQERPTPGDDLGADVAVRDLWARALTRLSDDDQEVLGLVVWDRLSTAQAAAALGCTTATLLTRLSRARRRLRSFVDDDAASPPASVPRAITAPKEIS